MKNMTLYIKRFLIAFFDFLQFILVVFTSIYIIQQPFIKEFNQVGLLRLKEGIIASDQIVIVGIDAKAINLLSTLPEGQGVISTNSSIRSNYLQSFIKSI